MDAPVLEGERVTLHGLTNDEVVRVAEMNALPQVARWWAPRNPGDIRSKLVEDDQACWVVQRDREIVGYVQAHEETHLEFRHAGVDLILHPDVQSRGLGREVVRPVCHYLFVSRGQHRIVIDPAQANVRAIRCYEAVGFRRVGILRSYWWDHVEERWADASCSTSSPTTSRNRPRDFRF